MNDNRRPTPIASAITAAIGDLAAHLGFTIAELDTIKAGNPVAQGHHTPSGRWLTIEDVNLLGRALITLCDRVDPVRAVERAYAELVAEAQEQALLDARPEAEAKPQ